MRNGSRNFRSPKAFFSALAGETGLYFLWGFVTSSFNPFGLGLASSLWGCFWLVCLVANIALWRKTVGISAVVFSGLLLMPLWYFGSNQSAFDYLWSQIYVLSDLKACGNDNCVAVSEFAKSAIGCSPVNFNYKNSRCVYLFRQHDYFMSDCRWYIVGFDTKYLEEIKSWENEQKEFILPIKTIEVESKPNTKISLYFSGYWCGNPF